MTGAPALSCIERNSPTSPALSMVVTDHVGVADWQLAVQVASFTSRPPCSQKATMGFPPLSCSEVAPTFTLVAAVVMVQVGVADWQFAAQVASLRLWLVESK